ncbi:MAG: hypothetical protein J1F22_02030 [Lachnospiraceae bacterium]|nr:hypothetical protein [Lachnospiraceae bacterium]
MIWLWAKKYGKRFFRQPLFIILLFLMPVGTAVFSYMAHQESTAVCVGIASEKSEGMGAEVMRKLAGHEGIITFVPCHSQEEIRQGLQRGILQCGYYFPAEMEYKLAERKYEGVVIQYYRRGSWIHSLVGETVFAAVFECYGKNMVAEYVMNSGLFASYQVEEGEIRRTYEENQKRQATFQFSYEESIEGKKGLGDYLTAPVKGVMALFILLAGFCGIQMWQEDKRRGLYLTAPAEIRAVLPLLSAGIPVLFVSIAGLMAEICGNFSFLSGKEIACLGIYDIMIIMFVALFAGGKWESSVMWGISLTFLFASAVATPVFVNLSAVIPGLSVFAYLCPPAYYLKAVYGNVFEVGVLLGVTMIFGAVYWWRQRKKRWK